MHYVDKRKPPFCNEFPTDCSFEIRSYPAGATVQNEDTNINYLIFCQSGHARITSTLFHDGILCAGEVMFVPSMSECSGVALSDVTLLVHKFNNTVCRAEKCILSYLHSHKLPESKVYCCKLTTANSMQVLMNTVAAYLTDKIDDSELWELKHKQGDTPSNIRKALTDKESDIEKLLAENYSKVIP